MCSPKTWKWQALLQEWQMSSHGWFLRANQLEFCSGQKRIIECQGQKSPDQFFGYWWCEHTFYSRLCQPSEDLLSCLCFVSARAELDGNRPRPHNPLTIIQVKDPERNMETGSSSFYSSSCPRSCSWGMTHQLNHLSTSRKWSFLISVLACACLMGVFLWGVPCSQGNQVCRSPGSDHESHQLLTNELGLSEDGFLDLAAPAALQQRMTDWSRKFTRIGKLPIEP